MNLAQTVASQKVLGAPVAPEPQRPTRVAGRVDICAAVDRSLRATIGMTGLEWGEQWLSSRRFYLLQVPLTSLAAPQSVVDPAHQMAVRGYINAAATVPAIVDVNRNEVGRIRTGYSPRVIMVAGAHNYRKAVAEGRQTLAAWVGELAAAALGIEIRADHQLGARELENKLRTALQPLGYNRLAVTEPSSPSPWVEEIFPLENYFIYTLGDKKFKQAYTVDLKRRAVSLTGEPTEVTQKYVAVPSTKQTPLEAQVALHSAAAVPGALPRRQGMNISEVMSATEPYGPGSNAGKGPMRGAKKPTESWRLHPKHAKAVHATLRRMGFSPLQSTTMHTEGSAGTRTRHFTHSAGHSAKTRHDDEGFKVEMQAPAEVHGQFVEAMRKHIGKGKMQATGTSEGAKKGWETRKGGGGSEARKPEERRQGMETPRSFDRFYHPTVGHQFERRTTPQQKQADITERSKRLGKVMEKEKNPRNRQLLQQRRDALLKQREAVNERAAKGSVRDVLQKAYKTFHKGPERRMKAVGFIPADKVTTEQKQKFRGAPGSAADRRGPKLKKVPLGKAKFADADQQTDSVQASGVVIRAGKRYKLHEMNVRKLYNKFKAACASGYKPGMTGKSAPGWEGVNKRMKENHPEIENPFALTAWMSDQGYTPHYGPRGGKKKD
jgi:hypothetical protein